MRQLRRPASIVSRSERIYWNRRWLLAVAVIALTQQAGAAERWSIAAENADSGQLRLRLDGQEFATYSYRDESITRPFFANIRLPTGALVTRHHPPREGDATDHARMHPGLWLAFGDISGHDYWRLRAAVRHARFVENPRLQDQVLRFAVENLYQPTTGQQPVCREICRITLHAFEDGVLMLWESSFSSEHGEFYFGDQEEMGLGVRMATPLAVRSRSGGRILDSAGRRNEAEVWGQQGPPGAITVASSTGASSESR